MMSESRRTFALITGHRALVIASILLVTAFSSLIWVYQLVAGPAEPSVLTAFYRHSDYSYFGSITRWLRLGLTEYMHIDGDATGLVPLQITSLWPYSLAYALFGGWGFWLADIFANLLRLGSAWILAALFTRDRRVRLLLALALFFFSTEYIWGDFRQHWLTYGLWSLRIPRPIVTSSFLLAALTALTVLPGRLARDDLKRREYFVLALPMVLLLNADLYAFLALALVYFASIVFWYASGALPVRRLSAFAGAGLLMALPLLIYMRQVSPVNLQRAGAYPVFGQLLTFEIPNRPQLVLLFVSFAAAGLALRHAPQSLRSAARLLMLATSGLAMSLVASPFFAVMNGFNIQEYHYAYSRDTFAGLLACLWTFFAVIWATASVPWVRRWGRPAALALIFSVSAYVDFREVMAFAEEHAGFTTEPEPGFNGRLHEGWRRAAADVVKLISSREEIVVIATFDQQLRVLLSMLPNTFAFLGDPQHTLASDVELENRFLILSTVFGFDRQFFRRWVESVSTQSAYLSGGKYQFNRIHVSAPPEEYPPQAWSGLNARRDNWGLWTPQSVVRRLTERYGEFLKAFPSDPMFAKYRLPDLLIVPDEFREAADPRGYHLIQQNSVFRVYELNR